jgi:hypothetical protein
MTSPRASTDGVFAPTGRRRRLLTLTGLVTLALMLYAPRLDEVPLHLHYDEVLFGLQAHALATTARDVDGHLLPLYMQAYPGANYWMQPLVPYMTAAVLKVLPLSDAAIRIPTVLVGLLNCVLIYCVARTRAAARWAASRQDLQLVV